MEWLPSQLTLWVCLKQAADISLRPPHDQRFLPIWNQASGRSLSKCKQERTVGG